MTSSFDWSFVRDFHPFPPRDRRLVLKEMSVVGVDHRDDESFYQWLTGQYRAGDALLVDAAIRRCCGKAEDRTSTQRAISWLESMTGVKRAPRIDALTALSRLAETARFQLPEMDEILDALEPNFRQVSGSSRGEADGPPLTPHNPLADGIAAIPGSPSSFDATTIVDRLVHALGRLDGQPDLDLLLRADALADAIDAHLDSAAARERMAMALHRAEAALAAIDRDLIDDVSLRLPPGAGIDELDHIASAAVAVTDAEEALKAARAAARAAVDGPRSGRRTADARLERAEDDRDAAQHELHRLLDYSPESQLRPGGESNEDGAAAKAVAGVAADAPTHVEADLVYDDRPVADDVIVPPVSEARTVGASSPTSDDMTDVPAIRVESDVACKGAVPLQRAEATDPHPPVAADAYAAEPAPMEQLGDWNEWINTALAAGRTGLALHLADARDCVGGRGSGLPVPVIEGLLRGRSTQAAYDAAWHQYEALRDPLMEAARRDSGADPRACKLALVAGALRPALLQSQTAVDVLEALEGDLAAKVNPLIRLLAELRGSGIGAVADIASPAGEDDQRQRAKKARAAVDEWRRTASTRTASFQGATAIWQILVAPDGAIGRVAAMAAAGAPGAGDEVYRLVDRLTNGADLLIDETDEIRGARRRNPVEGGARKQLRNFFSGAASLLAEWARAEGGRVQDDDRHRRMRSDLLRALDSARGVAVANAPDSAAEAAVASLFGDIVEALTSELRGGMNGSPPISSDDELALLPAFALNARRDVRIDAVDAPALATAAADTLATRGLPSPSEAFDQAVKLGALSPASRLLPHLSPDLQSAAVVSLDHAVTAERGRLKVRAHDLRQRLDDLQIALTESDQLPESIERDMSAFEGAAVDALPLDTAERGDLADFPAAQRRLDVIEERLEHARAPVKARLHDRIAAEEARGNVVLSQCRELLEKGDLGTLAEYISQVERHGSSGPAAESSVDLLARLVATAEALGDKPAIDLAKVARVARQGGSEGPFDFSPLLETDRARAEAILHAWIELRRALDPKMRGEPPKLRDAVARVLAALGFTGVRVEDARREKAWFHLTVATDPLRQRERCLAPAFGSEANGRYAVAVILDGEERSALSLFDSLPDRVLLIAATPLSVRMRRDLQRAARAGARSVAVADTLTAAVLATEPEAGTRAFFDLALPFGAAWPYVDSGSHTSIEMFFGRDQELRQLVDRQGACLVYGGRQLGKTALLKQIELRENVGADRVAIYCDIRPVGESMPPNEVWDKIAETLRDRKVVLPEGNSLADRLRSWAQAAPGRYMLVLLDEADAFLEAEMGADFPVIGRMKALMEDTGRGVKFVFAGLHNVQRFHRAPNSPLLHLGSSINVGPLLGGDREAARQMAFEPMAALGITFEQPVDAHHMLSLVGFYPSLVQSFGRAIVQAVGDQLKRPGEGLALPIGIQRGLIDDCFAQQAFRNGVVERFQKTLQLDERYELITYAVWQQAQQDAKGGRQGARGYPASEIRRMADEWWPAGFRDTDSPDSFAAILDEMVEMGVLARDGERYGLRSQRIAAMLGAEAEIEDRLQSFSERAPKRRADPMTSHRRIGGVWSPLSLRQEAALADRLVRRDDPALVVLIGATPATGVEDLPEALATLASSLRWPEPRRLSPQPANVVLDVVRSIKREASPGKPKVIVIPGKWMSPKDIAELRRSRLLRDPGQPVRVILCGLPECDTGYEEEATDCMRVILGPLPIESMVHWMNRESLSFADKEEVQIALRRASGGLLQVLDGVKRPPPSERGDPQRLIERAESAAAALEPADLGLDGTLETFARTLAELVGDGSFTGEELDGWAREHDPGAGLTKLKRLQQLGIVETVVGDAGRRCCALNPAAMRILS